MVSNKMFVPSVPSDLESFAWKYFLLPVAYHPEVLVCCISSDQQIRLFFLSSANSDEYRDGKLDESIFRGIFDESDRPTQKKLFYCSLIIITNMQKKIKQAKID